ncbi:hypothetical protein QBC45DRAFT_194302 [Copromyces sp. CBS 386.78]|nr:hypothetical protein QBC45DRAFT_194302 [Copromyces sp. CBS 386.78]
MKLTTTTTTLFIGFLAGLAAAQAAPEVTPCPTVTRTMQNRDCGKTCQFTDCAFVSTVRNPCGCPASIPTATLIAPCEADCPYGGCSIEFKTCALTCPATTTSSSSSSRRWPPWQTRTSTTTTATSPPPKPTSTRTTVRSTSTSTTRTTSTSYTQTTISWSIITLPPKTTKISTTPCPTVTKTTSPADCSPIRCPVPTCQVRSTLNVPCGCTVKTLLYVQGCATTCSDGCLTRTETASATGC